MNAELNCWYDNGTTPLVSAVTAGNLSALADLLREPGVDLEMTDRRERSPLQVAAAEGLADAVSVILPHYEARKFSSKKAEVLKIAARRGHIKIITRVMSEYNYTAKEATRVLNEAVAGGSLETVRFVLDNYRPPETKKSLARALTLAVRTGHMDILKLLLSVDGVDPNYKPRPNFGIKTLLMEAVDARNLAAADLLLTSYPDLDRNPKSVFNQTTYTALILSVRRAHLGMLKRLLEEPGVSAVGTAAIGPLLVAAFDGAEEAFDALLRRRGSNVSDHCDLQLPTCESLFVSNLLSLAAGGGNVAIVKSVLSRFGPLDVDSRMDLRGLYGNILRESLHMRGLTPLEIAAKWGKYNTYY